MSSTWEDISTQVDGHLAPVPILQADLWLQKNIPTKKEKRTTSAKIVFIVVCELKFS